MASLQEAAVEGAVKHDSPIVEIFRFISMTGARVGEVLHMEWEDFDEKKWGLAHPVETPMPNRIRARVETKMG